MIEREESPRRRCQDCIHLRTRRGLFWCRLNVDRDYAYVTGDPLQPPASRRTTWLQTSAGRRWGYLMASVCEEFEDDSKV